MTGLTDLHHHCIWGMDDGAQSFEESCRMLKMAAADGITVLAATPHAYPGYRPFNMALYRQRLSQLQRWAETESLPLTILEGAEIRYTDKALSMLQDGRIPTLGGTPCVLVEFSREVTWPALEKAVQELFRSGYIPLIAHVERYRKLYSHAGSLLRLHQEADVCFQVNASSIAHPESISQRFFLKRMLQAQGIDLVATDAHDCRRRPPALQDALTCLTQQYGHSYAAALTSFRIEDYLQTLCHH